MSPFLRVLFLVRIALCLLGATSVFAEVAPTEVREWRSTSGTVLKASATACDKTSVTLTKPEGSAIKVPLARLVEEDRQFLLRHFDLIPDPSKPESSGVGILAEGLPHPVGKVVGPIKASRGSYLLYLPKTLREGRPAPLLFITVSSGCKAKSLQAFLPMAERLGWIIAGSVDSKNAKSYDFNAASSKASVVHIEKTLPVDPDRFYFTGASGGGAVALRNSAQLNGAGSMPVVTFHTQHDFKPKGDRYYIGGTWDYNRYLSAKDVKAAGKNVKHRFWVGGHTQAPAHLVQEGMAQRLDFEAAMIDWIVQLKKTHPHRALLQTQLLLGDYEVEGHNREIVALLEKELSADPLNQRYIDGLLAIEEFASRHYAGINHRNVGHVSAGIQKASEELATSFAGVPEIEEMAKALGQKTKGLGQK